MSDGWFPPNGWVEKAAIAVAAILTALGGQKLATSMWESYVTRRKRKVETDAALLDVATGGTKDYIELFREVTKELRDTIAQFHELRRQHDILEYRCTRLTRLTKRMLELLKANGVADIDVLEKEVDMILMVKENG